ncbi:MAG: hypothetical protein ACHWZW_08450 [Spirulina sp.]
MSSPRSRPDVVYPMSQSNPSPPFALVYPSQILIGALVPPVLLGLITARLVADGFRQAGLIGEQLLQGQRLPHLHVHAQE